MLFQAEITSQSHIPQEEIAKSRKQKEGPPKISRIWGSIPSGCFFQKTKKFAGLTGDPGQNIPTPFLIPQTPWFL